LQHSSVPSIGDFRRYTHERLSCVLIDDALDFVRVATIHNPHLFVQPRFVTDDEIDHFCGNDLIALFALRSAAFLNLRPNIRQRRKVNVVLSEEIVGHATNVLNVRHHACRCFGFAEIVCDARREFLNKFGRVYFRRRKCLNRDSLIKVPRIH